MARSKSKPVLSSSRASTRPMWFRGLSRQDRNHVLSLVEMGMDSSRTSMLDAVSSEFLVTNLHHFNSRQMKCCLLISELKAIRHCRHPFPQTRRHLRPTPLSKLFTTKLKSSLARLLPLIQSTLSLCPREIHVRWHPLSPSAKSLSVLITLSHQTMPLQMLRMPPQVYELSPTPRALLVPAHQT
jgi:hypothetical protein